jgi:hypothetical protein
MSLDESRSTNSHLPRIRKRNNFFELSKSQRNKNKTLIRNEALRGLNHLCKSMGLKINEIKLSAETMNDEEHDIKISVSENNFTDEYKAYIWMMAKDITNMSRKKYIILKKLLKKNDFDSIPGVQKVFKIQHKLNDLYQIRNNDFGYFLQPSEKIKFVCTKFLMRNEKFKHSISKTFRIKLSADTVILSKKNRRLLNFTFSLLDDEKTAMSVNGTFVLGK